MGKLTGLLLCLVIISVKGEESEGEKPTEPTVTTPFTPPTRPPGEVYFFESFSDEDAFNKNWVMSEAVKNDDSAKYNGEWKRAAPYCTGCNKEDFGLLMPEANRLYAISTKMEREFSFLNSEEFATQFEVNFQDGLNCGGAYVKLLSSDANQDLTQFQDQTPYSIMFGPDKCGQSSKIHFIIRFKNPVTGEIEEKHAKQPTSGLDFFNDRMTHLFTLFIRKDDYYSISVDLQTISTGYLYSDLTPSVVPPNEIDDPEDEKPSDWDDKEKIPEPGAVKPDDWDEDAPKTITNTDAVKPEGWLDEGPETIPDPDASKPEDWDDEEDGEWEAPEIPNPACDEVGCGEWIPPTIPNPAYKGKWSAPLIDNPNYMGVWKPRRISNPAYFELEGTVFSKLTPISSLGFELWTVSKDILFDNIVVTDEVTSSSTLARKTWIFKNEDELKATGSLSSFTPWVDYLIDIANAHPYLWALYAIGLVLPFVLCAACCVRSKSSSQPGKDEVSRRKKTDEPTKDDDEPEKKKRGNGKKTKPEDESSFVASAEDEEVPESKEDEPEEKSEGAGQGEETVGVRRRKEEKKVEDEPEDTEFTVRKSPRRGGKKSKQTKRED